MPIPVPMTVDRVMVFRQRRNSARVSRLPTNFATERIRSLLTTRETISGMANTPISMGSSGMPDFRSNRPKVKRSTPPSGSVPMKDRKRPNAIMIRLLRGSDPDVAAMITRLRRSTAKSSGGPNCMTRKAIGKIIRIVKISLLRSPNTDEKSAMSSAFLDCPFLVS